MPADTALTVEAITPPTPLLPRCWRVCAGGTLEALVGLLPSGHLYCGDCDALACAHVEAVREVTEARGDLP